MSPTFAGFFVSPHYCVIFYKFKKTTRNEKWEKVKILKKQLKKPCIIGTKVATQVLKDGDIVESEMGSSLIKIIKK